MEPVDLDKALAETAKVKVYCDKCCGVGDIAEEGCGTGITSTIYCPDCHGQGFTYLYLGATDIQTRLPKRKGYPVEYRNMIPKEDG